MINCELFCQIQLLHRQDGLTASQIGNKLAIDTRTVAKWLDQEKYIPRKSPQKVSKLDPFKEDIVGMVEAISLGSMLTI